MYYGNIHRNILRTYGINIVNILLKIIHEVGNTTKNRSHTLRFILDHIQREITSRRISSQNNQILADYLIDIDNIEKIIKNKEITTEFLEEMFELFRKYRLYLPIQYLQTLG
jgi:hypothetical protein